MSRTVHSESPISGAAWGTRSVASAAVSARVRQSGFTLVELMVALTLSLLILAGMVALFANTSSARAEIDKASRQIENGRYALQVLSEDIRLAGYYGPLVLPPAVPASAPDPCSTVTADVNAAIGIPIQGYAPAASAAAPSCLQTAASGFVAGTGVLVVRHASAASAPTFTAGEFNIQSSGCAADGTRYIVGTTSGVFTLHTNVPNCKPPSTVAPVAPLFVRIYYVSSCSDPDCTAAGVTAVPTLKRMDVKPGGVVITPIVDGVENMQFDFGLDSDLNGSTETFTATTSPPSSVANLNNVMSIRAYVLARNTERTNGYTDTKTYALGSVSLTPGGNFKRHAYSELVRLNNPSGRRE